jgi:hypothetical protein
MKYFWGILWVSAILIATIQAAPEPFVAKPGPKVLNPEYHAEVAVAFLDAVAISDSKAPEYIRFLSFYNYNEDKELPNYRKISDFWVNSVHFAPDVSIPVEVPGTNGTLFWIDIRNYDWSPEAWRSVVNREPFFTEPCIGSVTANRLREHIKGRQDPKTLHVEAIVRADWFFRETSEADRSDSYFDLLFASRRFVTVTEKVKVMKAWKGGPDSTGKVYAAGTPYETEETRTEAKFVDFPKNEADFEKAFGVDKIREFIRESKINTQYGAVVEGGEMNNSIVSRQNRLVEFTDGPLGWYAKTYDVRETSGKRDFAEQLNKDFEFDAGEILTRTPAGSMAALVVDNKGKILKVADNRFATDGSDLKFDARVRTATSCFVCHETGPIKPNNLIEQMMKAGVDIKFKNPRAALEAKSFFLNWDESLEFHQKKFNRFLIKTSGFVKPGENAKYFKAWRDRIDRPVDLATAAAESGLPPDVFKVVASRSTRARILNLVQGISMPRRTWEVDGYPEIIKQLRAK